LTRQTICLITIRVFVQIVNLNQGLEMSSMKGNEKAGGNLA